MSDSSVPELSVLGKTVRESLDTVEKIPLSPLVKKVTMHSTEFTSLCPVTGQPDFGEVVVEFWPNGYGIESKSLKLYLQRFREMGSFCESLAAEIAETLGKAIQPRLMRVSVIQHPRGGIEMVADAEWQPERDDAGMVLLRSSIQHAVEEITK